MDFNYCSVGARPHNARKLSLRIVVIRHRWIGNVIHYLTLMSAFDITTPTNLNFVFPLLWLFCLSLFFDLPARPAASPATEQQAALYTLDKATL